MEKKNQPNKQTKIANLKYEKLEMQDYFVEGSCNKQIAQVIYKARTQALDIKRHNSCGLQHRTGDNRGNIEMFKSW